MTKNIAILGSTGSIGQNALRVIEALGEDYKVVALTAHDNIELLEKLGDLVRCLVRPLDAGDGIASGVLLQQDLDGVDYFGRFFSTRLRPPPGFRTRSNSTSCSSSCCRPRATV